MKSEAGHFIGETVELRAAFARPTRVDTVTKSDKFKHKIGNNTACTGDNIM